MVILNATAMLQDTEFCLHKDMSNFILNYAKPNTFTIQVTDSFRATRQPCSKRSSCEVTLGRVVFHSLR
jgi:hypothetical protein